MLLSFRKFAYMKDLSFPEHTITVPGLVDLSKYATDLGAEKKMVLKEAVEKESDRISELQETLYAEKSRSLLLIFQAMDAAGKDSCIRHVMSGVDPQGCQVHSFKAPNSEELAHDFLWRHAKAIPPKGMIGIHNRSHYEEVLVVKVHPEFLMGQRIPGITSPEKADARFWKERYRSIVDFEAHLARQGVVIMKFYLHMGLDAQKERFLERIKEPGKHWKFNLGDIAERALWDNYRSAYQDAIGATASEHAPWYIIPADDQWESRAIVSRLVREKLEAMDLRMPTLSTKEQEGLKTAKETLERE